MDKLLDFILLFLTQFAGGPGPVENNLVRFGLPAILWAGLFYIAWNRQRTQDLPREKLLTWGFGLAFVREIYMFGQMAFRLLSSDAEARCEVIQPLEHGLAMAAMIVVAAAFLRYTMEDRRISQLYLQSGIGLTLLIFVLTSWTWPRQLAESPLIKFHQTWAAWLFHIPLSLFMGVAVILIYRKRGWLQNVVGSALILYLTSELLLLVNYATDRVYNYLICPIGNSLHIFAIPLLGYIYLHEQSVEKKQAEEALIAYRDHLEELVGERTVQLQQEVFEHAQTEEALERLTHRYETILESAGEGICGINLSGQIVFANPTAVRMLGYSMDDLLNRACHEAWHPDWASSVPHSLQDCPIRQSYSLGVQRYGDDEIFWRKDGTHFPVRYFSNPVQEKSELSGAVVVFQDITERKRNEAEIARRNASLATQNAVAAALSQSLDIDKNLQPVLEMVRVEAGMAFGVIYLVDSEQGDLKVKSVSWQKGKGSFQPFEKANSSVYRLSRRAVQEKKVVAANLTDIEAELISAAAGQTGINDLVSVPMAFKGQAVGAITLGRPQETHLQAHTLDLLIAIGQQIGMAIENARLYRDVESRAGELARLQEASSYLTSSLDPDQVTAEIARQSAWLIRCQKACVIRRKGDSGPFELGAGYGLTQNEIQLLQKQLPELEILSELTSQIKTIAIQDASRDRRLPAPLRKQLHLKSALVVPIWSSERPNEYIIVMDTQSTRQWRRGELELVENLSNRGAVALVNASLHRQIELAAALQERQRIAANMHDGLAQTLSLLGLRVDKMQELISGTTDGEAAGVLNGIQEVVAHASAEVRRSIASLQEEPQVRRSVQDFLRTLCGDLEKGDGPELQFDSTIHQPLYLPSEQTEQLLMIAREAILNALNHAQAESILAHLAQENGVLRLTIEDNGCGFDLKRSSHYENHFGLSIMRARAARIGGSLDIDTSPGRGTRVRFSWHAEPGEKKALPYANK